MNQEKKDVLASLVGGALIAHIPPLVMFSIDRPETAYFTGASLSVPLMLLSLHHMLKHYEKHDTAIIFLSYVINMGLLYLAMEYPL